MAIWQYRLNFLPKIEEFNYDVFQSDGTWSEHDPSELWEQVRVKYSDLYLPQGLPKKSQLESSVVFGELDKYHLSIELESGLVMSIYARLDLRDNIVVFLKTLLAFAEKNELIIMSEDVRYLPNNLQTIVQYIQQSQTLRTFSSFVGQDGGKIDKEKPDLIKKWLKR
jgi:hypothetical protein